MSDVPQSDVSRPSKLPTANLLPQGAAPPAADQNSAEYLDGVEEEWNKKVDVEIETLADGMVDLVNLASVRSCEQCLNLLNLCTLIRSITKTSSKSHKRLFKRNFAQSLWYCATFSFSPQL